MALRKQDVTARGNYFDDNVRAAIVAMQTCTDPVERNQLWNTISPAIVRLAAVWIGMLDRKNKLGFDETTNECQALVYTKLGNFDSTRGTNSFSYFNCVVKNYVLASVQKAALREQRNIPLDDIVEMSDDCNIELSTGMTSEAAELRRALISIINRKLTRKPTRSTIAVAQILLNIAADDLSWTHDLDLRKPTKSLGVLRDRIAAHNDDESIDVANGLQRLRSILRRDCLFTKA